MTTLRQDLPFTLEACLETAAQARMAQQNGAHSIELCAHLDQDGLTPDLELIQAVLHQVAIPVKVMIRPRPGDFVYGIKEVAQMKNSIEAIKEIGIDGVVLGALNRHGELDLPIIATLAALAAPLEVTIHKAIDQAKDPLQELQKLAAIEGVTQVLTSGQATTALAGKALLTKMVEAAPPGITVIAAGGITRQNLLLVHQQIDAKAYHGRKIVGDLF